MRIRRATPKATAAPRSITRVMFGRFSRTIVRVSRPRRSKAKGGLRLDTKDGAFSKLKSDNVAIVPGKPDLSELIDRIENDDPSC